MLLAAAQINGLPLVTADRSIVEYATAHPGTPVVDARVLPPGDRTGGATRGTKTAARRH
jgi:hypothetical protein